MKRRKRTKGGRVCHTELPWIPARFLFILFSCPILKPGTVTKDQGSRDILWKPGSRMDPGSQAITTCLLWKPKHMVLLRVQRTGQAVRQSHPGHLCKVRNPRDEEKARLSPHTEWSS